MFASIFLCFVVNQCKNNILVRRKAIELVVKILWNSNITIIYEGTSYKNILSVNRKLWMSLRKV